MRLLKGALIAAVCCLNHASGLSDHDVDNSNANEPDSSEFQLSLQRALLDEGYSQDYLNNISDGIVQFERESDERDLFVRRICNIIERLYSDGTYSCECSMKPLAPQVSYTCERYTPLQSGRASYGVRYQGSFIFRYLALSLSSPASVCLTEMTYSSLALNGGRGGFLPFGDFCIESQLQIDVDPLQGEVAVSVDDCNVQLGDNLGTCTFCGACPTGPGFYIDCTNIWTLPFCVPNDIPIIGGRMINPQETGTETETQNVGGRFLEEATDVPVSGGGGSWPKGLVGGTGLPDPEKLFKALDLARLLQEKLQAILAEQSLQQQPTEPNEGSSGQGSSGPQTGTIQDPTSAWQPWADSGTDEPTETNEEPIQTDDDREQTYDEPIQSDDDQIETDDEPTETDDAPIQSDDDQIQTDDDGQVNSHPSQGATTQQIGPIDGPTDSWQPWAAAEPEETDDDSMPPANDDDDHMMTTDDEYMTPSTDDDEQMTTDDFAVQNMEDPYVEPLSVEQDSTSDYGTKKGKDKGADKEKKTKSPKGSTAEEREETKGMEKETTVKSQKDGKENKKTSSGKDKVRGADSSMRIQNLDGPSNEQMYDEDSSTQSYDTTEGMKSNHDVKAKKDDKGEKSSSTYKKENGDEPKPDHGPKPDHAEDQSGGRWGRDSDNEKGKWFKGFLRKSG